MEKRAHYTSIITEIKKGGKRSGKQKIKFLDNADREFETTEP